MSNDSIKKRSDNPENTMIAVEYQFFARPEDSTMALIEGGVSDVAKQPFESGEVSIPMAELDPGDVVSLKGLCASSSRVWFREKFRDMAYPMSETAEEFVRGWLVTHAENARIADARKNTLAENFARVTNAHRDEIKALLGRVSEIKAEAMAVAAVKEDFPAALAKLDALDARSSDLVTEASRLDASMNEGWAEAAEAAEAEAAPTFAKIKIGMVEVICPLYPGDDKLMAEWRLLSLDVRGQVTRPISVARSTINTRIREDDESRWIREHGSVALKATLDDGYPYKRRYQQERMNAVITALSAVCEEKSSDSFYVTADWSSVQFHIDWGDDGGTDDKASPGSEYLILESELKDHIPGDASHRIVWTDVFWESDKSDRDEWSTPADREGAEALRLFDLFPGAPDLYLTVEAGKGAEPDSQP